MTHPVMRVQPKDSEDRSNFQLELFKIGYTWATGTRGVLAEDARYLILSPPNTITWADTLQSRGGIGVITTQEALKILKVIPETSCNHEGIDFELYESNPEGPDTRLSVNNMGVTLDPFAHGPARCEAEQPVHFQFKFCPECGEKLGCD